MENCVNYFFVLILLIICLEIHNHYISIKMEKAMIIERYNFDFLL